MEVPLVGKCEADEGDGVEIRLRLRTRIEGEYYREPRRYDFLRMVGFVFLVLSPGARQIMSATAQWGDDDS
jgi:hypothetical protein